VVAALQKAKMVVIQPIGKTGAVQFVIASVHLEHVLCQSDLFQNVDLVFRN